MKSHHKQVKFHSNLATLCARVTRSHSYFGPIKSVDVNNNIYVLRTHSKEIAKRSVCKLPWAKLQIMTLILVISRKKNLARLPPKNIPRRAKGQ